MDYVALFYFLKYIRYVPKSSLKIEAKFIVDHINEIKIQTNYNCIDLAFLYSIFSSIKQKMDQCRICALKDREIRRVVRNLIRTIKTTQVRNVRSFKDHTHENPLAKVLNNFLKRHVLKSPSTAHCKLHLQLKLKIIEYLGIPEEDVMKRCEIILMRQIKANYTLDMISLQIRQIAHRIPELIPMRKKMMLSENRERLRDQKGRQKIEQQMGVSGGKNEFQQGKHNESIVGRNFHLSPGVKIQTTQNQPLQQLKAQQDYSNQE